MTSNQPSEFQPSFGRVATLLEVAFYGWVLSIEVFLRSRFGSRYIGVQGAIVLLIIPIYALLWEGYDIGPLFLFLFAFLAMCLLHRLHMFWRTRGGEDNHSRYNGKSHFQPKNGRVSEFATKRYIEPVIALVAGCEIGHLWCPPLGVYIIIGGFFLFLSSVRERRSIRMRSRDINDAMVDQLEITKTFRDMRGDRSF